MLFAESYVIITITTIIIIRNNIFKWAIRKYAIVAIIYGRLKSAIKNIYISTSRIYFLGCHDSQTELTVGQNERLVKINGWSKLTVGQK